MKLSYALLVAGSLITVGCTPHQYSNVPSKKEIKNVEFANASTQETAQPVQKSLTEIVQTGILHPYDSTTIGKAFDATFLNPTWTSFETTKGAKIVQFQGTMPESLFSMTEAQQTLGEMQKMETLMEGKPREHPALTSTVVFQFTFSADESTFQLTNFEEQPWRFAKGDFWDSSVVGYQKSYHSGIEHVEPIHQTHISIDKILAFIYN